MLRSTVVSLGRYSRMMDMGGVPSHKGNTEIRRKLQGSLSSKLKVRGVLLDYNVVCNQTPDVGGGAVESVAGEGGRGHVVEEDNKDGMFGSFSLPSHVADMANILGVNVSANSKGVGLEMKGGDKKSGGRDEEEEIINLSASRQDAASKVIMPPVPPKPSSDDPRLKYMAKLKEKRGLSMSDVISSSPSSSPSGAISTDGSFHVNLCDSMKAEEKKGDPNKYASRRWLPVKGMGGLLKYMQSRSIKIGLLHPPHLHSSYKEGDVTEFSKQLAEINFDYKFDDTPSPSSSNDPKDPAASIDDASRALDIPRRDETSNLLMVVSSNSRLLKAAREVNSYTCYLKPKNGRRCDISTNYAINTIAELRDVVDEINGISFSNVRRVDYPMDHGGV